MASRVSHANPAPGALLLAQAGVSEPALSPGRNLVQLVANRIASSSPRPENRQANVAACLRTALYRGATVRECRDLFLKLDPETQLCCYELLLRDHIVDAGIAIFLRDPASLVPHLSSLQPTPPLDLIQACQADLHTAHEAFQHLSEDDQLRCYELLCREEIRQRGLDEFLRNPSALLQSIRANRLTLPIIDHLIWKETGLLPRRYEYIPFLPNELVTVLTQTGGVSGLPRGVLALIADFVNDSFFGPEQWRTHCGATPVLLPPVDDLRGKVRDSGKKLHDPLEDMDADYCANFLEDLGREYIPESPEALYRCLNTPIRPGEAPAGMTCTVTFIPEFVRKDGMVKRVNADSIMRMVTKFGHKPKQGHTAQLYDEASLWHFSLADKQTSSCCFLVTERVVGPNTGWQKPSDLRTRIRQLGDWGWEMPFARDCVAALFLRCGWQGPFSHGRDGEENCAVIAKSEGDPDFLCFSGFSLGGDIQVTRNNDFASGGTGTTASRKFLVVQS